MNEPHVTLDPNELSPAAQKLREPLEEQLTSALQRATEQVHADYHGESIDEVTERLLDATRAALHPDIADAFAPDHAELRRVAEAIVSSSTPTPC